MNRRKVTAIVLVLALLLTLLPVTALAAVHEHTWRRSDSKSVKATCTKKGKIVYVCSCGKTKTESVPATGHSWGKWKTTTEATCDHAGEQVRKCGKCGQKETRKLDRKSHSWGKWKTTKQATCVQNGEQTRKCGKCGKKEKRKTDKIAHSWGKWTTTKAATCTQQGEQVRKCGTCGQKDTRKTDKAAHSWGKWATVNAATCTAEGARERKCAVCGVKQTEATPKLPHDWSEWNIIVEATDHSSGTRARVCRSCGLEEKEDYDPEGTLRRGDNGDAVRALQEGLICYGALKRGGADGSYGPGTEKAVMVAQEAENLTADGVAWPQTQARLGHRFGEWEVISELSDFSKGFRQRVCSRCGYTETEEEWPEPTYKRGDKGDGVKDLQEKLNAAGYNCGWADGTFGGRTEKAVSAIEADHGVEPDGIAWPGVQKWLTAQAAAEDPDLPPETQAEGLVLTMTLTSPEQDRYAAGEEVTFDWALVNNGTEDLILDHVFMEWGDECLIVVCESPLTLTANGGNTLSDTWTTALDPEWILDGSWNLSFYGRGYVPGEADAEKYITSNHVGFKLEPAQIGFDDSAAGDVSSIKSKLKNGGPKPSPAPGQPGSVLRSLVVVEQTKDEDAYYDGATIPVLLRLTIDSFDNYTFAGIKFYPGDSVDAGDWVDGALEAGKSYDFTYTMALNPEKTGWKKRNVVVQLRSKTTGKLEYETCEVRPPFSPSTVTLVDPNAKPINDYMAYLYLTVQEDLLYNKCCSGYPMEIPFTVDSDGNTDIKNVELVYEQRTSGDTFHTGSVPVVDKMKAGEHFDLMRQVVITHLKGAEFNIGDTLRLHLTGTIVNQKGKEETIESLPVDLTIWVQEHEMGEKQLFLNGFVVPKKNSYGAGDLVHIHLNVDNRVGENLGDVRIEYAWPYQAMAKELGELKALEPNALGINGYASIVHDYTIRQEDIEKGSITTAFVAVGTRADNGKEVRSMSKEIVIPLNDGLKEALKLEASVSNPIESYPRGMEVACKLALRNHTGRKVTLGRVYAVGDNSVPKAYKDNNFHDFGHGVKGYEYTGIDNVESPKSGYEEAYVQIPEDFQGDTYRAAWIVEADLANGTSVQSNVATIELPVGEAPEETLEMKVSLNDPTLEPHAPGEKVPIHLMGYYKGASTVNSITFRYKLEGDADWIASFDADTVEGFKAGTVFYPVLQPEAMVDGEWTYICECFVTERPELAAEPIVLRIQSKEASEPGAPSDALTLDVEQITADPADGVWDEGDEVAFKFKASYNGPETPASITVMVSSDVETEVPVEKRTAGNTMEFSDELVLPLDAAHIQDNKCSFIFEAFACMTDGGGFDFCSEPASFSYTVDAAELPVTTASDDASLILKVQQITKCKNPEGKWYGGEEVYFLVNASYSGEQTPHILEVDVTDLADPAEPLQVMQTEGASLLEKKCIIPLDSSHAVDGKCIYNFAAYAYVTDADTVDAYTEPISMVFEMAPAAGGPGVMPGGDHGEKDTQVNWAAIQAAKDAGLFTGEGEGNDDGGKAAEPPASDQADSSGTPEKADATEGTDPSTEAEKPVETGKVKDDAAPAEDGKSQGDAAPQEDGKSQGDAAPQEDGQAKDDAAPAEDGQAKDDAAPAEDGKAKDDAAPAEDGKSQDDGAPQEDGKSQGDAAPQEDGKSQGDAAPQEDGKSQDDAAPAEDGKSQDDAAPQEDGKSQDDAAPADGSAASEAGYEETVVTIKGEAYDIPATVCVPSGDGPFPAVVMLHGTGSTRDEAGDGYKHAAPVLAEKYGIATIRIDFPGNGDSTADYMQYTFKSAVADAKAAADYMAGLDNINGEAIGVMGWSQGGTDALLACAWEPETFRSIVTWAGAPDMMLDGFFSEADYEEAKANGFFVMEFDWRDSLNVSLQWCDDVANTDVLAEFAKGYSGPVLAIAGASDDTVDPAWSEKIVAASGNAQSRTCFIEGMDHTFNVFAEEDLHSLYEAVDATGAFFRETLG